MFNREDLCLLEFLYEWYVVWVSEMRSHFPTTYPKIILNKTLTGENHPLGEDINVDSVEKIAQGDIDNDGDRDFIVGSDNNFNC